MIESTVTVTVTAGIEPTKAMKVYMHRREYQKKYMRDYRLGKRRTEEKAD